jgi:transmembrane sensor
MRNKPMSSVPEAGAGRKFSESVEADQEECAQKLDDDSLMLFEEGLRAHLPDVDDIVARASRRKQRKKVARVLLLLALVSGVFWLDPSYRSEQIATAVGERGRWSMRDGSEIALNTNSVLRVEYHLRSRRLYLTQGEALFKVQHSRWRTFLVYAGQTRIEDIGTVFNVRNTRSGSSVMVLQGSVEVSDEREPGHKQLLTANQEIAVADGLIGATEAVDASAATMWQSGKLRFDNTPLKDVIAELQRYRNAPLILAPSLNKLQLSGQFDIDRIDQLLELLPTLAPVSVKHRDDGSIKISPRSS